MKFQERLESYIEQNKLIADDDKVLLTVSGGVDSMVLLDLFANSRYTIGVAHCNFQLRGEESDEDEVVVAEQCAKYGVPAYNKRFNTAEEVERSGDSMEMVARKQRYEWFEELRAEHGYTVIAVAHHADDSNETFFINLFRGTGLRGLTGIRKQFGRVVRPLSFATRKEILEYASQQQIPYREDSSNRSTKYLRNKIRLGLIPRIKEINPKFTQLMQGNLKRLSDAQQFITSCIDNIASEIIDEDNGIFALHLDKIAGDLPKGFVVYEILSSRFGFKGDVTDSLMRALECNNVGKRAYAKDYVAFTERENKILIAPINSGDSCIVEVEEGAGRSYCGNSALYYERLDIGVIESFDLGDNVALLNLEKLKYPLTIRKWQEGDSFMPLGMSGNKKVSDFLIDEKVSMAQKERQFVVVSGDDIVWVIGRRIDERYKVDDDCETVLKITREII
ncbi:MAG: tRNA lysidine(34) synthetase TilS [Rikenellaceae bacterium]